MSIRQQFKRTSCDCEKCQLGCRYKPGMLIPEDLGPIASQLLSRPTSQIITSEMLAALGKVCEASSGALVASGERVFCIPTIVPRLTPMGCVFYEAGKCTIHRVAPFGCSHFDEHIKRSTGNQRSVAAHRRILAEWNPEKDTSYRRLWLMCQAAGQGSSPLPERVGNYSEALRRIEEVEIREKEKQETVELVG